MEVVCSKCGAIVVDCERHVAECLSDRFEILLPNGTRVSLLDNGVDQRVADRHRREREAYYGQQDEHAKESRERQEAYLASYSWSLQSNRERFEKATADVSVLTQLLADNAVTLANATAACRAADRAIEAARVEARHVFHEVAAGILESSADHDLAVRLDHEVKDIVITG